MGKPTWVKVVGTLLIIMGCFGILGAWQTFNMPKMIAMQKQMMPEMKQKLEKEYQDRGVRSEEVMRMYEKMSDVPSWFDSWCLVSGAIALLLSGLLIFTAVSLFQLKETAVSMFYWVIGIDICFLIVRGIIGMKAMSWLGMSMMVVGVSAVITNVILLLVVVNGNKQVFSQQDTI